jgi:hypothetical protein
MSPIVPTDRAIVQLPESGEDAGSGKIAIFKNPQNPAKIFGFI